jgi:hypothetical protein
MFFNSAAQTASVNPSNAIFIDPSSLYSIPHRKIKSNYDSIVLFHTFSFEKEKVCPKKTKINIELVFFGVTFLFSKRKVT